VNADSATCTVIPQTTQNRPRYSGMSVHVPPESAFTMKRKVRPRWSGIRTFRYVALNPVKAKLTATAGDWPWSSTPAHLRLENDGLVTVRPLLDRVESFAEFLQMPADTERIAALTKGQTIGRPLMGDQELGELEKRLGRALRPGKRGRPLSQKNDPRQILN